MRFQCHLRSQKSEVGKRTRGTINAAHARAAKPRHLPRFRTRQASKGSSRSPSYLSPRSGERGCPRHSSFTVTDGVSLVRGPQNGPCRGRHGATLRIEAAPRWTQAGVAGGSGLRRTLRAKRGVQESGSPKSPSYYSLKEKSIYREEEDLGYVKANKPDKQQRKVRQTYKEGLSGGRENAEEVHALTSSQARDYPTRPNLPEATETFPPSEGKHSLGSATVAEVEAGHTSSHVHQASPEVLPVKGA